VKQKTDAAARFGDLALVMTRESRPRFATPPAVEVVSRCRRARLRARRVFVGEMYRAWLDK
jgi:hypothetical protein